MIAYELSKGLSDLNSSFLVRPYRVTKVFKGKVTWKCYLRQTNKTWAGLCVFNVMYEKKYKLPLSLIVVEECMYRKVVKAFETLQRIVFQSSFSCVCLNICFFPENLMYTHFSSSIHCLITHLTPTSLYNYSLWWCEHRQHIVTLCNATTLHHNEMSLQEKERRKKNQFEKD